eukprot:3842174-Alexandrium_andersonii.AAC.1
MPPPSAARAPAPGGGKGLWTPPAYHRTRAPGRRANRSSSQGAPGAGPALLQVSLRSPPGVLELLRELRPD